MKYGKGEYFPLKPRSSTGVPNNSIFVDTGDNVMKLKDNSGSVVGLSGYSGPTGTNGASGYSGTAGSTGASGYSGGAGAYQSNRQYFSSSGTWTSPAGVTQVWISGCGGGGGGGRGTAGGGGQAGQAVVNYPFTVTAETQYTVTVGTGGAGRGTTGSGGAGGSSAFGSLSLAGGNFGTTSAGGAGWTFNATDAGVAVTATPGKIPGGAGSKGDGSGSGGGGGACLFGDGGAPTVNGSGKGSGGGGCLTSGSSGSGADGFILVEW